MASISAILVVEFEKRGHTMRDIAQTRANPRMRESGNFYLSDPGTQCMAAHIAHATIASLFVKRFRPNPD